MEDGEQELDHYKTISIQHVQQNYSETLHKSKAWGHTGGGGSVIIIIIRPCKHSQRWRMHRSLVRNTRVESTSEEEGVWGHSSCLSLRGKVKLLSPTSPFWKTEFYNTNKQTNSVSGQTQAHCVSPETETEHTYGEDS